jgi:uncharacterized protein YbbK (DUF523 family)
MRYCFLNGGYMQNLLVSACLLGHNCKYNGGNNLCESLKKLRDKYDFIPICPETFGGLKSPRDPAEICGDCVRLKSGIDVSDAFYKGAEISLKIAKENNCKYAILKERSPSCGVNSIYDGSFSGAVISGHGITAKLLKENGIILFSEEEIDHFLSVVK